MDVERAVDWSTGDSIILGPTGFDPNEAERRTIASVSGDGMHVTVSEPFQYKHNGVSQAYSGQGQTWNLDERAEIADLNRNITIGTDGDTATLDQNKIGGHVMVMATSHAFIDGVEFSRMGQLGVLARYPFHWHLVGDARGQFIRNSSLHDTYQRCITVHGTNNSLVENNVCFNHFGHGYFLEDGNETGNTIANNLGMRSKLVPAGMRIRASDMGPINNPRFAAPATFWISNPANYIRDNVASGSDGSGFWMAFSQQINCEANRPCLAVATPEEGNYFPAAQDTLEFARNAAHSMGVGMTWDGSDDGALTNNPRNPNNREVQGTHYHPSEVPNLDDLVAFKTTMAGFYFCGDTSIFNRMISADNRLGIFFAYNQNVYDSLFVGASPNFADSELKSFMATNVWGSRPIAAALLYDGPFDLRRIHLAEFGTRKMVSGGVDLTAVPFVSGGGSNKLVDSVQGLSFAPRPAKMVHFQDLDGWADALYSNGLRDVDGTLTGSADAIVVPDHPLNRDPACVPFSDSLLCNYDYGIVNIWGSSVP